MRIGIKFIWIVLMGCVGFASEQNASSTYLDAQDIKTLQQAVEVLRAKQRELNTRMVDVKLEPALKEKLKAVIAKVQDHTVFLRKLNDSVKSEADREVFDVIKLSHGLQLMAALTSSSRSDQGQRSYNKIIDYFNEVNEFAYGPLVKLLDAKINPFEFLVKSTGRKTCIGAPCGHFTEIVIFANSLDATKGIVRGKNKQKLDLLQRDVNFGWKTYIMFSPSEDVRAWAGILLEDSVNVPSEFVLSKLRDFHAFYGIRLLYMGKNYVATMLGDNYWDEMMKSELGERVEKGQEEQVREAYANILVENPALCLYPKYLSDQSINRCLKIIKDSTMNTSIVMARMMYGNLLNVDFKPCILYGGKKKIGFDNPSAICDALKKNVRL